MATLPYNLTPMMGATDLGVLAQGTDVILGGHFFAYFTLFMTGFIVFIYMYSKGVNKAASFASSCWMLSLLALFLMPLGVIDVYTFWCCIFLTPISILVLFLSGINEAPS